MYSRIIKHYNSADVLQGTLSVCEGCSFIKHSTGGCLEAEFSLVGSIVDDYALSEGDIIRFYFDAATIDFCGYVAGRAKRFAEERHTYTVRGFWYRLAGVTFETQRVYTGQTCGAIVSDLLTNVIVPADLGIDPATTLIDSDETVESYVIDRGQDIYQVLAELATIASADGDLVVCGVDELQRLYFKAISPASIDYQATITAGVDVKRAEEREYRQPRNHLVVKAAKPSRATGWTHKKTYKLANGRATGRPLVVKVAGIDRESDFNKLQSGWFTKYADAVTVEGCDHLFMVQNSTPAKPWAGMMRYVDAARNLDLALPAAEVKVHFDHVYEYSIKLGLSGDAIESDRLAPARLEDDAIGNPNGYMADLAYPDVTDLTQPPDISGFPRCVNDDILSGMGMTGGGVGDAYTRINGMDAVGADEFIIAGGIKITVTPSGANTVAIDYNGNQFTSINGIQASGDDALTIAAGTNVSINTDAQTKTITINSTASGGSVPQWQFVWQEGS